MDFVHTLAGQGEHATLVQHPERLPDGKDSMSKDSMKDSMKEDDMKK